MVKGALLASAVAACALLAACSSGASSGGGESPDAAALGYMTALVTNHPDDAKSYACSSGWAGTRKFSYVYGSYSGTRTGGDAGLVRSLDPHATKTADGWTVRLTTNDGPLSVPDVRVVADGGRYYVCGYRHSS